MSHDAIPLAGVIGSPISHSRSPQVHGHWLKSLGIRGFYIPMEVAENDLEDALRSLPKLGFVGVNVTVPYKERVLRLADHVSDRATIIGAANTLSFRNDGTIHADNTDGYGFIENLRQGAPGWDVTAGPAAVLGAGGAARAVVVALRDAGAPEILISNRTRLRAEALQQEFGRKLRVVDWVQAGNMLEHAGLQKGALVTDLVYAPLKTRLLEVAEAMGCVTVDGLGMLLHQAVPGFERWFGARPEVDAATRAAALR
jgi:shikimate dehydrogenase